jgi:hypothetical protein
VQADTKTFKLLELTNGLLTWRLQELQCKHHQRFIPACGVETHKLDGHEAGEFFPDWGHTSGDLLVDQNGILVSMFLRALQANFIVSDLSVETWLILSESLTS